MLYVFTVPLSWHFWLFSTGKTSAGGDISEADGRLVSISSIGVTVDRISSTNYIHAWIYHTAISYKVIAS